MKVVLLPRVKKYIKKLPTALKIIIIKKLKDLEGDSLLGIEKLSGYKDLYRIRVGNYRVVFVQKSTVRYIVLIEHRREVYKTLKEIF